MNVCYLSCVNLNWLQLFMKGENNSDQSHNRMHIMYIGLVFVSCVTTLHLISPPLVWGKYIIFYLTTERWMFSKSHVLKIKCFRLMGFSNTELPLRKGGHCICCLWEMKKGGDCTCWMRTKCQSFHPIKALHLQLSHINKGRFITLMRCISRHQDTMFCLKVS